MSKWIEQGEGIFGRTVLETDDETEARLQEKRNRRKEIFAKYKAATPCKKGRMIIHSTIARGFKNLVGRHFEPNYYTEDAILPYHPKNRRQGYLDINDLSLVVPAAQPLQPTQENYRNRASILASYIPNHIPSDIPNTVRSRRQGNTARSRRQVVVPAEQTPS